MKEEMDKKDALISYLSGRNEELRKESSENEALKAQLSDLKQKYQELLSEQEKNESESRAKEESLVEIKRNLTIDIRKLENAIFAVENEQKKVLPKIQFHKGQLPPKNDRIAALNKEFKELEQEKENLEGARENIETDLENLQRTKDALDKEHESILIMSNRIKGIAKDSYANFSNTEREAVVLAEKIAKMKEEVEHLEADNERKKNELELAREGRKLNLEEVGNLSNKNKELEGEVTNLISKVKGMEDHLEQLKKAMDEVISLASARGKELEKLKVEVKNRNTKKLQEENETLKLLLDKYREDVELEKRLREEEAKAKYEISKEKQLIEREALLKELEAKSAERELARIHSTREQLLDEKLQTAYELEAVKEHVDLLESQNKVVYFCKGGFIKATIVEPGVGPVCGYK